MTNILTNIVVKSLISLIAKRQVGKGLMHNAAYMYGWGHALVNQLDQHTDKITPNFKTLYFQQVNDNL